MLRANHGASAPNTANATTGKRGEHAGRRRRHPQAVGDLVEDRADADRCRPQVEAEHDDPDDDHDRWARVSWSPIGLRVHCGLAHRAHPRAAVVGRPSVGCARARQVASARAAGAAGAAAAGPLRQARAAAVHQPPRLLARLRACRACARACRWRTRRGSTPTRGSRTPGRRRPALPARRSTSRSGWPARATPPRCEPPWTRRCRRGSTCSRSWSPPAARLTELLEGSLWRCRLPGVSPDAAADAVRRFLEADEVARRADDQEGACAPSTAAAAVVRLRRCLPTASGAAAAREAGERATRGERGRVCDTRDGLAARNSVRKTRRRPRRTSTRSPGSRPQVPLLHERLAQGPLDAQAGTVGDPLALNRDTA